MEVLRLAAFSHHGQGGNPAGVAFYDAFPTAEEMMAIAKEVGYSETVFLVKQGDHWRVRYFAPELEVPFCGHATIALGAALGERHGAGEYRLVLNNSEITVRAEKTAEGYSAMLQSPETWSAAALDDFVDRVLAGFHMERGQLDADFPVRFAGAGAKHLILFVKEHATLANMQYDFEPVRALMMEQGLITISLLWQETEAVIHSRNAFAAGGVYEDPATGAAAAALAGYLRDIGWPGKQEFTILQGDDMGMPSRLRVKFGSTAGESVSVSGEVRRIE